ncbi:hypothetical protein Q428_00665 [Fervidicella metallireducens AeB]|uniref:M23ase beta-sheet core domain-containing protein n=1 Tax=Fervidicella metallireducens AeB TaxID=1403537 RepID=A0A017RZQ6_9CLOT|nr:M23 family metallopeptidase [Fervidicella metallireducens]EYE89884.1 hypothetical protein Q428_00665 [Fervidicella metallireducens AeB]
MGVKNMFKKSSKLFEKEGFYIILFVCLCIVAVTAVYISRQNKDITSQPGTNKIVEEKETSKKPVQNEADPVINPSNNTTETLNNTNNTSSISTTKPSTEKNTAVVKKDSNPKFKMIMPVEGDIVKGFDKEQLQESKTMQQWETHEGIDIMCDMGTEVKAAQSGKVVEVNQDNTILHGTKSGFGVTVVIDHGNGVRSYYCNLNENVKVKVNDVVKKGQVLGVVGDTSIREAVSIEGSHLHFTVKKKVNKEYVTVNPMDYLK